MTLKFDMIQTVALAAVVLFAGYGIRRRVWFLDRFNIPAPVVGGFIFAALALAARQADILKLEFETTLQMPLNIAFFTSIGLGASLGLLKIGGPQVLLFFLISTVLAALQNVIGVLMAEGMGVHPFLGIIAGSITLTGGHGTGAAFGKLLEDQYQFTGGVTLSMAAATFGLVAGGLVGSPLGTRLITRLGLKPNPDQGVKEMPGFERGGVDEEFAREAPGEEPTAYRLLKVLAIILFCMGMGGLLSQWLGQYITLPGYIGAMIVAAIFRNLADWTKLVHVEQRVVDDLGTIALSIFLTMALMTLRLWELFDLALPMLAILAAQIALMAAFAYWITFKVMGRDYDAAIMSAGQVGFGLGATSNAVANMKALEEKFGPSPRAFLIVPMVGAFFIDFTNSLIITAFINFVE